MTYKESEISTAALTSADVPSPDGPLETLRDEAYPPIWQFASTYRLPPTLPREVEVFVGESALREWTSQRKVPDVGLDGKRLVLWWLLHHWRHTQAHGPWERTYQDYAGLTRALVKAIHSELSEEESWWWQPGHTPTDEERWERALSRSNEGRDVGELYGLAADVLSQAIEQRDIGVEDPLNLPLTEADPVRAARVYAAYLLARGLIVCSEAGSLEEARDAAYSMAT